MQKLIGKNILDAFITISPFLNDLLNQDVQIAVLDTERFLDR